MGQNNVHIVNEWHINFCRVITFGNFIVLWIENLVLNHIEPIHLVNHLSTYVFTFFILIKITNIVDITIKMGQLTEISAFDDGHWDSHRDSQWDLH